jgi:hypothetical protein
VFPWEIDWFVIETKVNGFKLQCDHSSVDDTPSRGHQPWQGRSSNGHPGLIVELPPGFHRLAVHAQSPQFLLEGATSALCGLGLVSVITESFASSSVLISTYCTITEILRLEASNGSFGVRNLSSANPLT